MLTLELVKVKTRQGVITPTYIDPTDKELLELAGELLELFRLHVGRPWGELKEALRELQGDGPGSLVARGLVKLIEDQSEIEADSALEPREVRRRLFEAAAKHHPVARLMQLHRVDRATIIAQVAGELGVTPEAIDVAMYADLPDAHLVREVGELVPEQLLQRYNLSLAQAVLLRAQQVRIVLSAIEPARARQLFRFIRFFRLMFQVTPQEKGGYLIQLDGPLSLFKQSQKYGLQFATFLPALLLCEGWMLEADVEWGTRREARVFRLTPRQGLISHYPDKGVYETREEQWFRERFSKVKTQWKLEAAQELLPLAGQGLLVPDFRLVHPDGRVAWLEIIGFWRRSYLERRLELYRKHGPGNLILAVSKQLQSSLEGLEGFEGEISIFREVIVPKDILERAERVGR